MTVIDTERTLATLVTDHPSLARDVERLGLDYCCGGDRSLADACRERGLDPAAVADGLAAAVDENAGIEQWATMGPAALVDHIERPHHAYLWDELPRIQALAEKVTGVHGDRHPELTDVRARFGELRADLEPHLRR